MKVLLTGCAGFIGSHLLEHLLEEGHEVVGVDNFSGDYGDAAEKAEIQAQLNTLASARPFKFIRSDLADQETYQNLAQQGLTNFDSIIHLASVNAGSASNQSPSDFVLDIAATHYLLDFCKDHEVGHFIFGSSSYVYGSHPEIPCRESHQSIKPHGPDAESKLSCEQLGKIYSDSFPLCFIALRIFTTYGPRQHPNMAMRKFADCLNNRQPIVIHGNGDSSRDYVYIDDVVSGISAALNYKDSSFEVINLGSNRAVDLKEVILKLESTFGVQIDIERRSQAKKQPHVTLACLEKATRLLQYRPKTSFEEGVERFAEWFCQTQLTR